MADSTTTVADIAAGVRLAFFEALAAGQAYDLAVASKRIADSLGYIADRRFASGDISRFEDDQVGLEAARVGQLVSRAREALGVALASLARSIAWPAPPDALHPAGMLDDGLEAEAAVPAEPASLPFVQAAIADSTVADFRRQSAERARIPMPSFEAGAEWSDPTNPGKAYLVLGLAIPLPLWNQGGREAAIARAQSQQAAGLAQEARLEGARRLTEAAVKRRESAARARIARDSLLPAAIRLRERATAAFRAGETGVVPVLDAVRAEREIALSVILELLTYQGAVTEWNRLLGFDR
jgi:cobalt-zinc-cadmium efflux system outer membrane protein